MFRNSLKLEELASVLGARVLEEKALFLASGVVLPSLDLLVTMNRDRPVKRYEAKRAYLLLVGRRLAPIGVEPGPGVGGPGKILVVHQIWENGTLWNSASSQPVGVVPVMVLEPDMFVLRERP